MKENENENENTNIKKMISNLVESDYIKEGWFDKETFNTDSIIDCIKKCTSPRASKKNKPITEDDLKLIFKAFSLFKPSETRVLILGQDPYPDNDRAHGLAFSFKNNQKPNDSILNIFKAIKVRKEEDMTKHFCDIADTEVEWYTNIETWARNKCILLLNTALTYQKKEKEDPKTQKELKEKHKSAWNQFVQYIIRNLINCKLTMRDNNKLAVFLWGVDAQNIFSQSLKKIPNSETLSDLINAPDKIFTDKEIKKLLHYPEDTKIDNNNNIIRLFLTSHPSNNYQAVKQGFCYEAPNHFAACDKFLCPNDNGKYIFKDFPENNTK